MNQERINISSSAIWEDIDGYSRLVKVGNQIFISGTTATDESGKIIGIESPFDQTVQCILNIEKALNKVGADLSNIVRTRIYVKNINNWEEIGKAHGKFFDKIKPATSMVEISNLILPEILVEIEADAIMNE